MPDANLSEIQEQLIDALKLSAKVEAELEAAKAKLQPLENSAIERRKDVQALMDEFQRQTGSASPAIKGRGRSGVKKGPYNIEPSAKVDAVYKRTVTRLVNAGTPEPEAKKKAKITADALRVKLGLPK